jgi:hypothetical protein
MFSKKRPFQASCQGCIGKFLDCYCCNCLGERRWEGRPSSHLRKTIASVCHVTPFCKQALFLHECFSDFLCRFVCDGWQIEQRVCIRFCVKLGTSAAEKLEMLREASGEHSLNLTAVYVWHSRFKTRRVSFEDDERSGRPSTSKTTEIVEKFENASTKTVAGQSLSLQTPLGSVVEFARRC